MLNVAKLHRPNLNGNFNTQVQLGFAHSVLRRRYWRIYRLQALGIPFRIPFPRRGRGKRHNVW